MSFSSTGIDDIARLISEYLKLKISRSKIKILSLSLQAKKERKKKRTEYLFYSTLNIKYYFLKFAFFIIQFF